jgi:RNA 3'-terminal phosphate cyclase (ATP)
LVLGIDGGALEGGGQILRASIALSAVVGEPIRIFNVRARRSKPGLRLQHMAALRAVAELTDAETIGLEKGSREVEFHPKHPLGGRFRLDVGSAGSTTLVLQALMPVAAFASEATKVEITGGTNNPMAPPIEFLQRVLLPTIAGMGYRGSIDLRRRGFYPRGMGFIRAYIDPIRELEPIQLTEFGEVKAIRGLSYSCRLPPHITERMAKSSEGILRDAGYEDVEIELERFDRGDGRCSTDPGCGIVLFAETTRSVLGADSLGKLGKPAEEVGREAAEDLIDQLRREAPIDRHLGDQLIVYAALARGRSVFKVSELTLHTLTCIRVSEKIVGASFEVVGKKRDPATIFTEGIGLKNRFL